MFIMINIFINIKLCYIILLMSEFFLDKSLRVIIMQSEVTYKLISSKLKFKASLFSKFIKKRDNRLSSVLSFFIVIISSHKQFYTEFQQL